MFFFRDPLLIFFLFFLGGGGVYSGHYLEAKLWNKWTLYLFLFVVESLKGGIFDEYYLNLHDPNLQRATRVKSSCFYKVILSFKNKHLKIQVQLTFFPGIILTFQSRNKGMIKDVSNGSILLSVPLENPIKLLLNWKSNQIKSSPGFWDSWHP